MSIPRPARTTTLRTTVLAAGAFGIAALAAGCGGSDGGGGSKISAATGADIFKAANCSSCHTLAASGATGVIGPNLDQIEPDAAMVKRFVTDGAGRMPSFKTRLDAEQIQTLADYVAESTKK